MTNEIATLNRRIFSLEFADHLENVDSVCNLMHGFMTAVLQSQKSPPDKKKNALNDADEPNSFRIHISIYERS
jgi:hypothetical protein